MTAAGKRAIAEATRKRWAAFRAAKVQQEKAVKKATRKKPKAAKKAGGRKPAPAAPATAQAAG